jgi:hypothetical protein
MIPLSKSAADGRKMMVFAGALLGGSLWACIASAQSAPAGLPNGGRGATPAPSISPANPSAASFNQVNDRSGSTGITPDSSSRGGAAPTPPNFGSFTVQDAGLGALVGPGGQNAGSVTARFNAVSIDGRQQVAVDLYGDKLVSIAVPKADGQGGGAQKTPGDGDQLQLTPRQASRLIDNAVNMNGVVQAQSVFVAANGDVVLGDGSADASKPPRPSVVNQPKQKDTTIKLGSVGIAPVTTSAPSLQQKDPPSSQPPQPAFGSLLTNWARSIRPLTPGDALATGAGFDRNGALFAGYFADLFSTGFPLANALGDGQPPIDYAICYLANMWLADTCSASGSPKL